MKTKLQPGSRIERAFTSEAEACAFWNALKRQIDGAGRVNGARVLVSEMDYNKDRTFTVRVEIAQ